LKSTPGWLGLRLTSVSLTIHSWSQDSIWKHSDEQQASGDSLVKATHTPTERSELVKFKRFYWYLNTMLFPSTYVTY